MKFGTLLTNLAKKAGVDTSSQAFIDLLSTDIEVPDDIAGKIDTSLMNEEAAKSKLRTKLRTEALDGIDSKVEELLGELGYGEEDILDVKGEKNTYEKVAKLVRQVKNLEAKKAGSKGEAKEALEKKIEQLNADLKTTKEQLTKKEEEWKTTREGDLTTFEIQKKLLGKQYSLPTEMDEDLKLTTVQGAIQKALQAQNLQLKRNELGQLVIMDKDGNKAYTENHEEIQVDSFIDGALARNKLLKVNDQSSSSSGGDNQQHTITSGGAGKGNTSIVAEIDASLFK